MLAWRRPPSWAASSSTGGVSWSPPPRTRATLPVRSRLQTPEAAYGEDGGPSTSGRELDWAVALSRERRAVRVPRRPPAAVSWQQPEGPGPAGSLVSFRHDGSNSNLQLEAERQQKEEEQRRRDFYANVGDAIRTLREDIPVLFVRDLNYGIYREDIVFKDPNISFHGLKNYKLIFWSLRFHGRIFFKALYVEVQRIWQPDDVQIKMRWKVYAKPRLGSADATFDGISTYRLDRTGKIYEHAVDNVQLRDPPLRNPLLYFFNFLLAPAPSAQQMPVPGSWYEDGEEGLAAGMRSAGRSELARVHATPTASWDEC